MAFDVVVEVRMTLNDNEELEKVLQACSNGLAEVALKDRILFNGYTRSNSINNTNIVDNVHNVSTGSSNVASKGQNPPDGEFKRLQLEDVVKVSSVESKVKTEKPKPVKNRSKGILGRGRMSRNGG